MPMLDGKGPHGMGASKGYGKGCCGSSGCGCGHGVEMLTKRGRKEFLEEMKKHLEEKLSVVNEALEELGQ